MTNKLILSLLIFQIVLNVQAQYSNVRYDREKNYFNEGQELPFESYIMLNGEVPKEIELIEVSIHKSGRIDESALYSTIWRKANVDQSVFNLPLNYKLRQNNLYGFRIGYYYRLTPEEKITLYNSIGSSVMTFIDQSIKIKGNEIEIVKGSKTLKTFLDEIVNQGLHFYRNDLSYKFPGFSEIIDLKLKDLEKMNLKENKYYQIKAKSDSTYDKKSENYKFFKSHLTEFKKMVDSELVAYINTLSYVVAEVKEIDKYKTQRGQFILPVNIGYGAIYNSGSFDELSYAGSPYVGLSFPLANSALKSNILSKSSISVGAYINNFNNEDEMEISGPFVNRPLFIGVGSKALQFFRINAGATILQESNVSSTFSVEKLYLRPSININFELGLWIGQLR